MVEPNNKDGFFLGKGVENKIQWKIKKALYKSSSKNFPI